MEQFTFDFGTVLPVSVVAGLAPACEKTPGPTAMPQAVPIASAPVPKSSRKASARTVPRPAKPLVTSAMPGNDLVDDTASTSTVSIPTPSVAITPPAGRDELPSFAEALDFIDAAPDLTPTKRRDLRSSLISAAKLLGQQPRDIKLDPKALSNTPLAQPPKLIEKQVKRRRNILSGLNKTAALMGLVTPHRPGPDGLLPAWLDLRQRLKTDYEVYAIARLARFASDRQLAPRDIDTAIFATFSADFRANTLKSDRRGYLRRLLNLWTHLNNRFPDLALQPIDPPSGKAALTLPLATFPVSFREELAQFEVALSPNDLGALHDDLNPPEVARPYRPARPMKPSTLALRIDQLRYAASALVQAGTDPTSINTLRDLFTPTERAKNIVRQLRARTEQKQSSHLVGVMEALRHAARFYHAEPATQAELARLRDVVSPKRDGVVAKNRERLRAMIEPGARAIIISLPQLLLDDARKCADPLDAARRVRTAVTIELLTVAAPRLDNLNFLHLERSLRRAAGGKRHITHLIVDETDVKNGVPIERQLPAETSDLLETWLTDFRPRLAKPGNPWLFPGDADAPLSRAQLRKWISRAIRDYAGVEVHPHLFRHFCAWLHLQAHPGDYEGVRRLLGHKSIQTAIKSYIAFEQDVAAARYDQVVLRERQAAKTVARQLLRRGAKGRGKQAQTEGGRHVAQ
jgi:integrase